MSWNRGHTIGRGFSATVSIATCRQSGDIFAVKSVELSQSQLLQREQKILSCLSNPRIVSYKGYDITRENNKPVYNLKIEYATGGTLTDEIQRRGGWLDESVISFYTQQIVQGLDYLHSSGVVHCDIKGRNILVGENGVKIADMGCAKWIHPAAAANDTEASAAVPIGGTPMFMAPEVARGEEQGFPADIWALGCTIIEMATGGSPWANSNNFNDPMSILYQIAYSGDLPDVPKFLSHQAKDFLSKCLNRNPKERWTVKQLAKHPFLQELNSDRKQNQEFNTSSPTSILDQGVWSSVEESETLFDILAQTRDQNSHSTPVQRIRRLSACSTEVPSWRWEETWITIRENKDEKESDGVCGAATDVELERSYGVGGDELILNCLGNSNNVSSRNSSSKILMACTCTEHCFERHKEILLINDS